MVVSRRDEAISEVIGFVLILALIAIVASLYLTYVVPAQGRDMEIADCGHERRVSCGGTTV